ncbi:MAG: ABC transporter ATP-binding protein [Candidatus Hydrogenedens sp.]|nr:ABC transporter ATP-binding protein [Candidatus Hydrogenedens sp.]
MTEQHPPFLMELKSLTRSYAGTAGDIDVLKGVDLKIQAGESIAIVGPSGCGKSTLLNCMGGLDRPDSGEILFKGQSLSGYSAKELARFRNKEVAFVLQQHHLLPQCTVLENVLIPTLVARERGGAYERALALLEEVGLGERLHHRPQELSGGECQRVAVVRALINRPGLLLADEPTGSLNEENAFMLVDLLLHLNREQGMALVMVTHSLALAERLSRLCRLHDGKLEEQP